MKKAIYDDANNWMITFGYDSDAIIWDLEKMNDIQTVKGDGNSIFAMHLNL